MAEFVMVGITSLTSARSWTSAIPIAPPSAGGSFARGTSPSNGSGATLPDSFTASAAIEESSGKPASVAWTAEPLSLAALYADRDLAIAPEALAHIEPAAVASTQGQVAVQTASQLMAAAAYAVVAQGQADRQGKLDVLK